MQKEIIKSIASTDSSFLQYIISTAATGNECKRIKIYGVNFMKTLYN
jgi:hypothetical protein